MLAAYTLLLVAPQTREHALWLGRENHPVELVTFAALLVGSVWAMVLAWAWYKEAAPRLQVVLMALFGIGLGVVAMEEIAWGQEFFHFATPEGLRDINLQGQTTLHNIKGFHGHARLLYIVFGLGGLAAYLPRALDLDLPSLRALTPSRLVAPYFVTIALSGLAKLYIQGPSAPLTYRHWFRETSEVIEMLIGLAGLLYVATQWYAVRADQKATAPPPPEGPDERGGRRVRGHDFYLAERAEADRPSAVAP